MVKNIFMITQILLFSSTVLPQEGERIQTSEAEVKEVEVEDQRSVILSLAGVLSDSVTEVKEGTEKNSIGVGGGVLIEAQARGILGLETGVLLVNRQYDLQTSDIRIVQEVKRIHVPLTARYWPTDFFSVGIGPFLAIKAGDKKTNINIGDTLVGGLETSAEDTLEFGLDFAGTFNLAISGKTGLFAEGRYSRTFARESNENNDDLSALMGVKVDL